MNALGASVLAALALVVVCGSRRLALLGMMAGVLYMTRGQGIDLFGANFQGLRLLEIAGFARVLMRREFPPRQLNGVDRAFLLIYSYTIVVFLLRSGLGQSAGSEVTQTSAMDKIGTALDAVLSYFVFRALTRSLGDMVTLLRDLVLLIGPYVVLLLVERTTTQNPFAILGGMPEVWDDGIRVRCRGSFEHPSLLGTFGASFLPLYIGLVFIRGSRTVAITGAAGCLAIVLLSNSGGPASFAALSILSWLLWFVRTRMYIVRRIMVAALVALAVVMKAPIWYLPDRLSSIFGGDGWHRSYLMNQAFTDIDRWWAAGMALEQTRDWFPYLVMGAADITNFYIALGLDAGIVAIGLFIFLLVRAFQGLGHSLAMVRQRSPMPSAAEFVLWGFGAALTGHVSNFLAITYFDQTYLIWVLLLAAISTVSELRINPLEARARSHATKAGQLIHS